MHSSIMQRMSSLTSYFASRTSTTTEVVDTCCAHPPGSTTKLISNGKHRDLDFADMDGIQTVICLHFRKDVFGKSASWQSRTGVRTSITVSSQTPNTSRGPGTSKTCYSAVHYSSHCTDKSIVILAEKMVLECNTVKEAFNRNLLQKDQVAHYHRKRKYLNACRGRNDRLMEDYGCLQTTIYRFLNRHKSFGILTRRRRVVNPASVNLKDLHLKFIDL